MDFEMNFNIEIILVILSILCSGVAIFISYYLSVKKMIESSVVDAINMAEELDAMGAEKMAAAVETIYELVPVIVKPFISRQMIEVIVQTSFDKIEEYALKQIKKGKSVTSVENKGKV